MHQPGISGSFVSTLKQVFSLFVSLGLVAAAISVDQEEPIRYTLQDLTTEGFANLNGCKAQLHNVTTLDRYYMIIYKLKCHEIYIKPNGKVVFIQHGLTSSSDEYVWRDRNHDLAYQLIEEGYEVWLGNSRGNVYSGGQEHSVRDENYWDFSFHEMGVYDMPAAVDYVLQRERKKKLTLIGTSLGTIIGFVFLSELPEYNHKVSCFICLAPVVYTSNTVPRKAVIMPGPQNPFNGYAQAIELELLGIYAYDQKSLTYYQSVIEECGVGSPTKKACIRDWVAQPSVDKAQFEPKFIVPFKSYTSPSSTKTVEHVAQNYFSGRFQQFDYGLVGNLEHYNQFVPPEYNLSKVRSRVLLCVGPADPDTDTTDVERLMSQLSSVELYTVPFPQWNHADFTSAKDTATLLNIPIIQFLRANKC